MSRPRQKGKAAPLSSVLTGVLRKVKGGGKPTLEEMGEIWARLAGQDAAEHSWPHKLAQKRLVVEVENSGWMYALGLKRAHLVEGLIELLGAGRVKALTLRIGEKRDF